MENKRTIETPPDLASVNVVNLKRYNLEERVKPESHETLNKYKKDRKALGGILKQVKQVFETFQKKHETVQVGEHLYEEQEKLGETGHQQK